MGISSQKDSTLVICSSGGKIRETPGRFMLKDPIGRVIGKLVLPSVIAMAFSTIHMLFSWMLVGRDITPPETETTDILSLLAVVNPLEQLLLHTLPSLVGAGTSVLVSRLIGEGLLLDCNQVAGNALVLQLLLSLISILVYPSLFPILCSPFFTSSTIQFILPYLHTILWGSPITFLSSSINALMRGQGAAIPQCCISVISTCGHILLDFYFVHVRREGLSGLAYAHIASSLVSSALSLLYLVSEKSIIRLTAKDFRLRWRLCWQVFTAGLPGLASTVCPSVMSLFRTRLLMRLLQGVPARDVDRVISVFNSVQTTYFVGFVPLIALSQGTSPIFAYAYGAKKHRRFKECGISLFRIQSVWVGIAFLGLYLGSGKVALLFSSDPAYCSLFESSLRVFSSSLLAYPVIMTLFPMLQTTGHGALAGLLLAMNECLTIVPLQLLFGELWEKDPYRGFLCAYPVNAIFCMLVSVVVGFRPIRPIFHSQPLYRESRSIEFSFHVFLNKHNEYSVFNMYLMCIMI